MSRAFSADVFLFHGSWGICPMLAMNSAPLALDRYGAVRRPRAAAVTDEDAPQARRHNDLATK